MRNVGRKKGGVCEPTLAKLDKQQETQSFDKWGCSLTIYNPYPQSAHQGI